MNRALVVLVSLLLGATAARARKRHRPRAALTLPARGAPAGNLGAQVESAKAADAPAPPRPKIIPTFFEFHSARVENDLMLFESARTTMAPPPPATGIALFAPAPVTSRARCFTPGEAGDGLEALRERDRLLLFRGPQPAGGAVSIGLALFAAATTLSAHAPRPLRFLFDGAVHLGPAVFEGGGMGAGIAGRR